MPLTPTENAQAARLSTRSNSDFANDAHRTNFVPTVNDVGGVAVGIGRVAQEIDGAVRILNGLDADTDGAFSQYVAASATLRFGTGGIQKHTATAVAASGQTLHAFGESRAVWIDPAGVEHAGDTYTTTTGGAHQLWMPASDINATGTDLRLNVGGALTHLYFPPDSLIRYLNVSGNDLKHLDLRQHREMFYVSAFNNDLVQLDLSLNTALVTAYLYGNPLAELATDHLVNLQILSVSHCALVDGFETSRLGAMTLLHAHNNTMTQAGVDRILLGLDAAGVTNCTIRVDGNNAPPSSAGLSAVSNLTARNCTVTHS